MHKIPAYKSYEHNKHVERLLEHHSEIKEILPKECPHCASKNINVAFGYVVRRECFFTEQISEMQTYWSSFGRNDVLNRVARDNNTLYKIEVSKNAEKVMFTCDDNACYIKEYHLTRIPDHMRIE